MKSKGKKAKKTTQSAVGLKWYFPPTGGGVSFGFNDSGQEHFRANAWEHTIREIIQNSLDAVNNRGTGPVVVKIFEMTIPASELGVKNLEGHVKKALERTIEQENKDGIKFYENALKVLKQNEISVLAITDTNTTGLVNGKWKALIYDEGAPSKGDMAAAGGSFGIGKSAPYLVSALRTVCYSTRYLGNGGRQEKFIGRCKISAHADPKMPSVELQHIGFGTKSKFEKNTRPAPTEGNNIYHKFRLDKSGSGIFIIGFVPRMKDWIRIAEESIAHNFFVAIHERKLEVFINSDLINYETLDNIFENGNKKEPTRHYYRIIRDNIKKNSIEGTFGKFTMQIQVGDENSSNQIAYVNRRGMMITDQRSSKCNPFHTSTGRGWAKYAAVIRAKDDTTDKKIRTMEPPNHRSIEYERINEPEDRKIFKKELQEIRKKVEDIVNNEISSNNDEDNIYLSELADVLPIHNDNSDKDGFEQELAKRHLKHRPIIKKPIIQTGIGGNSVGTSKSDSSSGGSKKGSHTSSGENVISSKDPSILHDRRIIRNKNKLRVAFTPVQNNENEICFAIVPAGEEKRNESVIPITPAQVTSLSHCDIGIKNNRITLNPEYNKRVILDVEIQQSQLYTGYEIIELSSDKKFTGEKK